MCVERVGAFWLSLCACMCRRPPAAILSRLLQSLTTDSIADESFTYNSIAIMATNRMLSDQLAEATRFWRNKQIRTALMVPWAESFTAAFITPVYPYFLQGLGMEASQMGVLRAIQLALNAASAPLVGSLLDTHGPWLGITLPSSACALGCALKASASGFTMLEVAAVFSGLSGAKVDMAIAHTAKHTPEARRTLAVSAANVQQKLLLLLGTLCFTPLDALLKVLLPESRFGMLRFRLEISLCMIGCGFGVLVLLLAKDTLVYGSSSGAAAACAPVNDAPDTVTGVKHEEEGTNLERGACCSHPPSDGASHASDGAASGTPPRSPPDAPLMAPPSPQSTIQLLCTLPRVSLLAQVALFFSALVKDMTYITWPLFLKEHFGWAERQYGLLLPITQVLQATILIAAPWVHERLGTTSAILWLGLCATLSYLVAFSLQAASGLSVALHLIGYMVGDMCNRGFEIVLTAFASTYAPPQAQGRLFALMAIMRYAGSISGSLAGTALYQFSVGWADGPPFLAGGALPTTLIALPAMANVLALAHCAQSGVTSSRRGARYERPPHKMKAERSTDEHDDMIDEQDAQFGGRFAA